MHLISATRKLLTPLIPIHGARIFVCNDLGVLSQGVVRYKKLCSRTDAALEWAGSFIPRCHGGVVVNLPGKRRIHSCGALAFSFVGRLSFRDPNLSHQFVDALPPGEKDLVVARRIGAVPADGEGGIDRKPFLRCHARLVEPAKRRQGGREVEMRGVEMPADLDRVAQLRDSFFVLAEKDSRDTQIRKDRQKCREG
jgi:hypothetical protein